jgi:hypothetical protein
MSRYILVYKIDDQTFAQQTKIEFFAATEEQKMHERVNQIADERVSIITAGFLQTEYEYKPDEIIKKYRPKRK